MAPSTGVKLKVVSGGGRGKTYHLNKNIITIGSDPTTDVRVQGDPDVAPVHVEIQKRGDQFMLFDRSGRGTIVNTRRVEEIALDSACQVRLTARSLVDLQIGAETANKTQGGTKALLRRPIVLIGGGLYALGLIGAGIYLSGSEPASSSLVTPAEENQLVENYMNYLERTKGEGPDQKIERLQSYLRSAHLAERSGNIAEAHRIYLELIAEQATEMSRSGTDKRRNPVYAYALSRLSALP